MSESAGVFLGSRFPRVFLGVPGSLGFFGGSRFSQGCPGFGFRVLEHLPKKPFPKAEESFKGYWMSPFILTVPHRDSSTPYHNPYYGLLEEGVTSHMITGAAPAWQSRLLRSRCQSLEVWQGPCRVKRMGLGCPPPTFPPPPPTQQLGLLPRPSRMPQKCMHNKSPKPPTPLQPS